MNKTEEIIKVAQEGGFYEHDFLYFSDEQDRYVFSNNKCLEEIFMNPKFWEAIGKAKGWKYKAYKMGAWQTEETDLSSMSDTPFRYPEWQYHAITFYNINLTQSFDDAINYLYELIK